ncbi:hypothetical protein T10_6866, partial [Trichinella papuae]
LLQQQSCFAKSMVNIGACSNFCCAILSLILITVSPVWQHVMHRAVLIVQIADPFEFGYCAMTATKFAIDARIENGKDVQEILDHWIQLNLTKTTTGGKIQIDKVKSDHDKIRRPTDQKRDHH